MLIVIDNYNYQELRNCNMSSSCINKHGQWESNVHMLYICARLTFSHNLFMLMAYIIIRNAKMVFAAFPLGR